MSDDELKPVISPKAIEEEIRKRTLIHQGRVARLGSEGIQPENLGPDGTPDGKPLVEPLCLLAIGDSWFDYPLVGNGPTSGYTDIILKLKTISGIITPEILNVSAYGEATTDELALPKKRRLITALQDLKNWPNGKPDAILFSGGGNDFAGEQLSIYLDEKSSGRPGLNELRFKKMLGMVEASYLDLFEFRNGHAPGVHVVGHAYDVPIPNGVHPWCGGPWLKPSLSFSGWDVEEGKMIMRRALELFQEMLIGLESDSINGFSFVRTQGTLREGDWANELHPIPEGFELLAKRFVVALQLRFPGRM